MQAFDETAPGPVSEAFKKLLTEKHLCQYVEVDTLPDDFKNRFPSLYGICWKLSAAMHEAMAVEALFEDSCAQIIAHFDARRGFKL
jgi:hypothetical protein